MSAVNPPSGGGSGGHYRSYVRSSGKETDHIDFSTNNFDPDLFLKELEKKILEHKELEKINLAIKKFEQINSARSSSPSKRTVVGLFFLVSIIVTIGYMIFRCIP